MSRQQSRLPEDPALHHANASTNVSVTQSAEPNFTSFDTWALRGHGIVLRSEWDAARHLRAGRLVEVLPRWSAPAADIWAVFPTRQHLSARTRSFVDHLAEVFGRIVF